MSEEVFFKHPELPFVECRYSTNSERHYKPHIHKTLSIGAIVQGEVRYQVGEKVAKLKPGSLALINPEILHSCNPSRPEKRSYYVLYLDADWCLKLQQSLWQVKTLMPFNRILLEDKSLYRQYIQSMDLLMGQLELLEKERILIELVENIFLQACSALTEKSTPNLSIERLKQQLSHNLDKDISLGQLALAFNVNSYTLLRQFKAALGITPHAYRTNCRIEYAKALLQKGLDLSQVASECGFFDQSHFHRHFKAITAVTPKEYQVNFIQ